MDKEAIKEILKNEIELFKIYAYFIIGLTTGISGIVISKVYSDEYVLYLLFTGILFLLVTLYMFAATFIKIKRLIKKLEK